MIIASVLLTDNISQLRSICSLS